MSFLERIFSTKLTTTTSTELIKVEEQPDHSRTILLKGKIYFTIFQDGNGYYRAQHKSGDWLRDEMHLSSTYEYCFQNKNIEKVQEFAMYYLRSQQLTEVGTIEFIPHAKN